MGALLGIGRLFLVAVNIIFLLAGTALTFGGLILRFGESISGPYLNSIFGSINQNVPELVNPLAIGMIIVGLLLLVFSFIGFIGACYKIDTMLYAYAIAIALFLIIEAVVIGLLYGRQDLVKEELRNTLKGFRGLDSTDATSVVWNAIMILFGCCGVESYNDFAYASNWVKDKGALGTLVTPIACCKDLSSIDTSTSLTCATNYSSTTNNGATGCYNKFWDHTFGNLPIAVLVLAIIGIVQIAFIVVAICIAMSENDNRVSPMNVDQAIRLAQGKLPSNQTPLAVVDVQGGKATKTV